MPESSPTPTSSLPPARKFRWWPALVILGVGGTAFGIVLAIDSWAYIQARNTSALVIGVVTYVLLALWWSLFSRLPGRVRLAGCVVFLLPLAIFRLRGMTGDFVPIVELRFGKKTAAPGLAKALDKTVARPDFPQLFGPTRDCKLSGPRLAENWSQQPPEIVWRRPVGAAWGGLVVAGGRVVTQEQDGEMEAVTCYDLLTGEPRWKTTNPGRYDTKIAGIGPRATPTVVGDAVFTLGALGTLRCLELANGQPRWTRELKQDAGVEVPDWGFASSPLVHEGKVIVSAGGPKSLLAYRVENGEIAWTGGTRGISYSSPFVFTLAGRTQIVMFNNLAVTAHDPATGAVLWERAWGKGTPHVSRPVPVGDRRLFVSSGYGVGCALWELTAGAEGALSVDEIWKKPRFQAKFSNPVERDGFLYGVSDGIFSCLDLATGDVKWKNGRYGHGQGLLVGEHYLQMTEDPGELVLLKPTPVGPNELARIAIFAEKTWNPLALSGDLLLVRNDTEAACLRLPLAK